MTMAATDVVSENGVAAAAYQANRRRHPSLKKAAAARRRRRRGMKVSAAAMLQAAPPKRGGVMAVAVENTGEEAMVMSSSLPGGKPTIHNLPRGGMEMTARHHITMAATIVTAWRDGIEKGMTA